MCLIDRRDRQLSRSNRSSFAEMRYEGAGGSVKGAQHKRLVSDRDAESRDLGRSSVEQLGTGSYESRGAERPLCFMDDDFDASHVELSESVPGATVQT